MYLTIHEFVETDFSPVACDSYTWFYPGGSQTYVSSTTDTKTFQTVLGCDSIVTIHLTIHEFIETDSSPVACDSYTWFYPGGSQTYTSSTTDTKIFKTVAGCDSIVTMSLTINLTYLTSISDTITNGETYDFHGKPLTTAGTYYHTFTAVNTCDSVIKLDLAIRYTIVATTGGNGTITPLGTTTVNAGANQTFTFIPVTGYHVATVLVDGLNNPGAVASGSYTFNNVNADHIIHVTYAINTYTITASAGSGGTMTPLGTVTVEHGDTQIFTFAASSGYTVHQLVVNGVNVTDSIAGGSYTFTNISKNHFISISFIGGVCPDDVIDIEGNLYFVTNLAGLCWTENMRTRTYPDGVTPIPFARAYHSTVYSDSATHADIFGLLYCWHSAVGQTPPSRSGVQGICPDGWYIPTQTQLELLSGYPAQELMSIPHWITPAQGADDHGFTALPAGIYSGGKFINLYGTTGFWSANTDETDLQAYHLILNYHCGYIQSFFAPKANGLSIRCVKSY
jgi:uncharacterized protein (TIGR02145 family)